MRNKFPESFVIPFGSYAIMEFSLHTSSIFHACLLASNAKVLYLNTQEIIFLKHEKLKWQVNIANC